MNLTVVIAHTEEGRDDVRLVSVRGDWGDPIVDATGLMAWGIWDVQCGPDTLSDLAQIEGVELYDGKNWRQESGWVDADPEDAEPINNESHEDN